MAQGKATRFAWFWHIEEAYTWNLSTNLWGYKGKKVASHLRQVELDNWQLSRISRTSSYVARTSWYSIKTSRSSIRWLSRIGRKWLPHWPFLIKIALFFRDHIQKLATFWADYFNMMNKTTFRKDIFQEPKLICL